MEFSNELSIGETILIGSWKMNDNKVIADETCWRIEQLITSYLTKVPVENSDWEVLYLDPNDNRYWLLTYPNSEWHGGGPPTLQVVASAEVYKKFEID